MKAKIQKISCDHLNVVFGDYSYEFKRSDPQGSFVNTTEKYNGSKRDSINYRAMSAGLVQAKRALGIENYRVV